MHSSSDSGLNEFTELIEVVRQKTVLAISYVKGFTYIIA